MQSAHSTTKEAGRPLKPPFQPPGLTPTLTPHKGPAGRPPQASEQGKLLLVFAPWCPSNALPELRNLV